MVETVYRVKGRERRALARVVVLSSGFRLLVGHDLAEADLLSPILWRALLSSLVWLTLIGTVGGLAVARRVLHRVRQEVHRALSLVAQRRHRSRRTIHRRS